MIRTNKNTPVFRVARPYLNLLVKPRIFFRFSGKKIILCILKGKMLFKMHKIIFFPIICVTLQKISDLLHETHLVFYLASLEVYIYVVGAQWLSGKSA